MSVYIFGVLRVDPRAYLYKKGVHPFGEGLLLYMHTLLLKVLDATCLKLVEGVLTPAHALHGGRHGGEECVVGVVSSPLLGGGPKDSFTQALANVAQEELVSYIAAF